MRAKFDLFNKADGWNLNRFFFRNIFVSSSFSPCLACINYESSIVDISEKPIANFQIKVEFFSMIGKKNYNENFKFQKYVRYFKFFFASLQI